MLDHRCNPIWYDTRHVPDVDGYQWKAVVERTYGGGADPELLRLLFERPAVKWSPA